MYERITIKEFIEWLEETYKGKLDYVISYIDFSGSPEEEPYINDENKRTSIE